MNKLSKGMPKSDTAKHGNIVRQIILISNENVRHQIQVTYRRALGSFEEIGPTPRDLLEFKLGSAASCTLYLKF